MKHDNVLLLLFGTFSAIALILYLYFFQPWNVLADTGAEVLCADSIGMEVIVKEKYGGYMADTGTVVFLRDGFFYTTHRDGFGAYPSSRWALVKTSKLEE